MDQAFSLQVWANMWDGIFSSGGWQPSDYLNTGRHMQGFQKHKTTGCRKPGVQARRIVQVNGGWARAMFGSPLEAFDSARAAMLSRCSRPQPQTARLRDRLRAMLRQKVRSILACCETQLRGYVEDKQPRRCGLRERPSQLLPKSD